MSGIASAVTIHGKPGAVSMFGDRPPGRAAALRVGLVDVGLAVHQERRYVVVAVEDGQRQRRLPRQRCSRRRQRWSGRAPADVPSRAANIRASAARWRIP
jgi:hypothetical protein